MVLRPRSGQLSAAAQGCRLYNLNVRGKRGNIVQVYPSVEYDFIPNRLNIDSGDCIHIQWTGEFVVLRSGRALCVSVVPPMQFEFVRLQSVRDLQLWLRRHQWARVRSSSWENHAMIW